MTFSCLLILLSTANMYHVCVCVKVMYHVSCVCLCQGQGHCVTLIYCESSPITQILNMPGRKKLYTFVNRLCTGVKGIIRV